VLVIWILNKDFKGVSSMEPGAKVNGYFKSTMTHTLTEEGVVMRRLNFEFNSNDPVSKSINESSHFVKKDDSGKLRLFTVLSILEEHDQMGTITVEAEDVGHRLLRYQVRPFSSEGISARSAFQSVLSRTNVIIGLCDYNQTKKVSFEDNESVLERIGKLNSTFGTEVEFVATMKGTSLRSITVNIQQQIGTNRGQRFEYPGDILNISREISMDGMANRIYCFGKINESGVEVNISDVVMSKSSGDLFDKPAGVNYIEDKESVKRYGLFEKTFTHDTDDVQELAKRGANELVDFTEPEVVYQVQSANLSDVFVADTVTITDKTFSPSLDSQFRVIDITKSDTDYEESFTIGRNKKKRNKLAIAVKKVQEDIRKGNVGVSPGQVGSGANMVESDMRSLKKDYRIDIPKIIQMSPNVVQYRPDEIGYERDDPPYGEISNVPYGLNTDIYYTLPTYGAKVPDSDEYYYYDHLRRINTVEPFTARQDKSYLLTVWVKFSSLDASFYLHMLTAEQSGYDNRDIPMAMSLSDSKFFNANYIGKWIQLSMIINSEDRALSLSNVAMDNLDTPVGYSVDPYYDSPQYSDTDCKDHVVKYPSNPSEAFHIFPDLFSTNVIFTGMVLREIPDIILPPITGINDLYLVTDGEVRAWRRGTEIGLGGYADSYMNFRGAGFLNGSSIKYKDNLKKIRDVLSPIEYLMELQVFEYHLKSNLQSRIYDKPKLGLINEMAPRHMRDEDGIDTYALSVLTTAALQDLIVEVNAIKLEMATERQISDILTKENMEFRQEVDLLKSQVAEVLLRLETQQTQEGGT
jgi:phage minor structural protein